jgi:hypothetical protein
MRGETGTPVSKAEQTPFTAKWLSREPIPFFAKARPGSSSRVRVTTTTLFTYIWSPVEVRDNDLTQAALRQAYCIFDKRKLNVTNDLRLPGAF